jgi:AraC-like DNA-binding protein
MITAASDFGPFHFSTDALPARDRMAIWREVFGRHVVRTEFEPVPDQPFANTATMYRLPGLSLAFNRSTGFQSRRTRPLVADGNDDLNFTINVEGAAHASQLGRDAPFAVGEAVLLANAEVGTLQFPARARLRSIGVSRRSLSAMVQDPEAAVGVTIRSSSALRLLSGYLAAAEDGAVLADPELRHVFATHAQDLVALVIGATRDAAELAKGRGLRAARLRAIKTDILGNIASRNLSLDVVAVRLGISPIYIRKLLEGEDTSFSKFVLEQRLMRAYRMLNDPRFARRPIAAIAMDAGFGDLSYFNRAFRRRYGAAPSDVRAAARSPGHRDLRP